VSGSSVAVFGATSAIAEQVARRFAARGARLFLVARDPARLERIAADLAIRGAASVHTHAADFDDAAALGPMLEAMGRSVGVPEIALVAFGTLGNQTVIARDVDAVGRVLTTNFVSPARLITAVAVLTSVAGERGRASNYVYGAAKAGLSTFLQGLRHRLAGSGVQVLDIRPGPVDTPMTRELGLRGPLLASAERVAADIERAIDRRRSLLYTPWFWRWIMLVIRALPEPIFHRLRL
jgi:short-subunit dehydrogenase